MKIFCLCEYQFKDVFVTDLEMDLVEQNLDAMMKRAPTGVLCILGVQHIVGRDISLSVTSR